MIKLAVTVVVLLVSCGPRSSRPAQDQPGTGDVGAVCGCGGREGQEACVEVACKPDLVCGYPCGVDGCDSVCMTKATHDESKNLP